MVKKLPQLLSQNRVQTNGRFVECEQPGRAEKGHSEAYPRSLATGESSGQPVCMLSHANLVEYSVDVDARRLA